MLIIALVLAVIGLAALVFAVVTSNALVAWVCIGASVLGVLLLVVDALSERRRRDAGPVEFADADDDADDDEEQPDQPEPAVAGDESEEPAVPTLDAPALDAETDLTGDAEDGDAEDGDR